MYTRCISSSLASILLNWRNPDGSETSWQVNPPPVILRREHTCYLIKQRSLAACGLTFLATLATIELLVYGILSLILKRYFPLRFPTVQPLLHSSAYTLPWLITACFTNIFYRNIHTHESQARNCFARLVPEIGLHFLRLPDSQYCRAHPIPPPAIPRAVSIPRRARQPEKPFVLKEWAKEKMIQGIRQSKEPDQFKDAAICSEGSFLIWIHIQYYLECLLEFDAPSLAEGVQKPKKLQCTPIDWQKLYSDPIALFVKEQCRQTPNFLANINFEAEPRLIYGENDKMAPEWAKPHLAKIKNFYSLLLELANDSYCGEITKLPFEQLFKEINF
ncbi:MAG: hypothetical protein H0X51_10110 [Parachlamydiaceae bacterium]|nr:hypothetical protein [Parachlamydiaceae bacterium]